MRRIPRWTGRRPAAVLALMALAGLHGCEGGGGDDVAGPTPPAPPAAKPTLDVTVTLTSVTVVEDCDDMGFPSTTFDDNEHGEFQYGFWVSWPDGTNPVLAHTGAYTDQVRRGATSTTWTHGESSRKVLDGPGPYTIRVSFQAIEWDKDLISWYRDEWLDNQLADAQYTFRTGDVRGGNADGSFSLGNKAGNYAKCHLRANYTVRTVEGVKP